MAWEFDQWLCSIQFNSIQFNSIQFRHLYAPANKHHVGAHGEKATIIKVHEWTTEKNQSINCEKVRFQFCSKWVERESGITQVQRERVPHGRRGVIEPSWTQCLCFSSRDRIHTVHSSRSNLVDERMLSRPAKVCGPYPIYDTFFKLSALSFQLLILFQQSCLNDNNLLVNIWCFYE